MILTFVAKTGTRVVKINYKHSNPLFLGYMNV